MGLAELPDWHDIDLSGPLDGVLYDKADGIALITLNRPDRGNSFHAAMGPVLRAIWEDVRADQDVRAVVVTGTGDRHFCTGVDVGVVSGSGGAVAHNRPFEEEVSGRRATTASGSPWWRRSTAPWPGAGCTSSSTPTSSSPRRTPGSSTRTRTSGWSARSRTSGWRSGCRSARHCA